MCGIAGIIGPGSKENLTSMSIELIHRGPDDHGVYIDEKNSIYFAHRRLSIVDLAGGAQPMQDQEGKIIVIFNGEIYNFLELKKELINRGHNFNSSHSDTEVLIHGYKEWGEDLPTHLNGMFAFAIYDKGNGKVFMARDRFGEKPLYYYYCNGNFAFSSELSSLSKYNKIDICLDDLALQKYFAYGYIPAPLTIYKNCYKLKPGYSAIFDIKNKKFITKSYWNFSIDPDYTLNNEKALIEELDYRLKNAINLRLRSDVPLGIFLSGGIDSSALLAYSVELLGKDSIDTFTIGFDDNSFDESGYAKQIADFFGVKNHHKILNFEKMKELCPSILNRLDEPIADPSVLPTFFLSEFARQHVTVALGGDGGDELFAGYDPFNALKIAQLYSALIPQIIHKKIRSLAEFLPLSQKNMSFEFKVKRALMGLSYEQKLWNPTWLAPTNEEQLIHLFNKPIQMEEVYSEAIEAWVNSPKLDPIDKTMEFFTKFYLPGSVLAKVDKASMMNSLEVRAVFLDNDLAEFCMKLPNHYKFRNGTKKYLLKKLLDRKLPQNILQRKKKGFGVPLSKWLMDFPSHVPSPNISQINYKAAENLWNQHRQKKKDNRMFMWTWLVLDNFLKP